MKKILLITGLMLSGLLLNTIKADKLVSRTTSGGLFGYYRNTVEAHNQEIDISNGSVYWAIYISCKGLGFNDCPGSIPLRQMNANPADPIGDIDDKMQSANLMQIAIDQISNGNLIGNHNVMIQTANGQVRNYMVSWNSLDTQGNDSQIDIFKTVL